MVFQCNQQRVCIMIDTVSTSTLSLRLHLQTKCGGQSTFVNRTASSVDICGAYDGLKEEARKTHTLRDLEFTKSLTY